MGNILGKKFKNLEELEEMGYVLMDSESIGVGNSLLEKCEERGITLNDLSKITGISRQTISSIAKGKMRPGLDFVLKCSFVLGVSVNEIFELPEDAWTTSIKGEDGTVVYLNMVTLQAMNNEMRAESDIGEEYTHYDTEAKEYLTRKEKDDRMQEYIKERKEDTLENMKKEYEREGKELPNLIIFNSMAITKLKKDYMQRVIRVYRRIGVKSTPYVIPKP